MADNLRLQGIARTYVGTSGWVYKEWRGSFYPEGLPQKRELEFASRAFNSLEINRSFYSLLTPASCRAWYEASPADFVFSIKGSSFITHSKRLGDAQLALANFFAAGTLALADKLGPVVWQLPKNMTFDAERLESFFAHLPRSLTEAAKLAQHHDGRPKHGVYLDVKDDRPMRHVIEPRHDSFFTSECAGLLRKHEVALAISDSPDWPYVEEPTTDFMYVRLHGSQKLYASRYTDAELDHWAARAQCWSEGREPAEPRRLTSSRNHASAQRSAARPLDVYVYFDNTALGHAVDDSRRLADRLRHQPEQSASTEAVRGTGKASS